MTVSMTISRPHHDHSRDRFHDRIATDLTTALATVLRRPKIGKDWQDGVCQQTGGSRPTNASPCGSRQGHRMEHLWYTPAGVCTYKTPARFSGQTTRP